MLLEEFDGLEYTLVAVTVDAMAGLAAVKAAGTGAVSFANIEVHTVIGWCCEAVQIELCLK